MLQRGIVCSSLICFFLRLQPSAGPLSNIQDYVWLSHDDDDDDDDVHFYSARFHQLKCSVCWCVCVCVCVCVGGGIRKSFKERQVKFYYHIIMAIF